MGIKEMTRMKIVVSIFFALLSVVPSTSAQDTLDVVVVLPMFSQWEEDSLSVKKLRLREVALDCWAGVSLALDSASAPPAHFAIRFVEAGEDTAGLRTYTREDFLKADLVIGPLRRSPFAEVHHMAPDVPHLALTDLGASTLHLGQKVFMPYTLDSEQMRALAQFIPTQHAGENTLMLASESPRTRRSESAFRRAWHDSTLRDVSGLPDVSALREVACTDKSLGAMWDSTTLFRRNIVIAPGGKACRSLAGQLQTESHVRDSIPIVVYAHSDWADFDFLSWDWREEVALTTAAQGFHAEDDSLYADFTLRHALSTGRAPSKFSTLAYDATLDVASRLVQLGTSWMAADQAAPAFPVATVHHRFDWHTPARAQGWINNSVRLVRQQNYRRVEVDLSTTPTPAPVLAPTPIPAPNSE